MPENDYYKKLPVFLQNIKIREIFKEVIDSIPKDTEVFLVGGTMRNAMGYAYHSMVLPQRDFDLLLVGNLKTFIDNLRKRKFIYGKIRRKHEVVLKRKKVPKPKNISDYVVLDIHLSKERNIAKNIKDNADFMVNGFAISLKDILSSNWQKKMIVLPGAFPDMKNKQLRVNKLAHPSILFGCIRLMSKGFKKPSQKEIRSMLGFLSKLEKYKWEKNVKKVFDYVGGKKEAYKIVKTLGIKEDIFDLKIVKEMK